MADKRRFVQFPHPGREHDPASGRDWNKLKYGHRRSFGFTEERRPTSPSTGCSAFFLQPRSAETSASRGRRRR